MAFSDAAIRDQHVGVGIGVFLIDGDGNIICAMKNYEDRTLSPLAAEVYAIIQAVRLLIRLNIHVAKLHSDSSNAIHMINGEQEPDSEVYHWISQIQEMRKEFETLNFTYISRYRNSQANALAKLALRKSQSMLWMYDFPHWLKSMGQRAHCKCSMSCLCNC